MAHDHLRDQWDSAAPGWARWEPTIARWMEEATIAMLDMAGVGEGDRVLDLACGAGSQTFAAAERVGPGGSVVAADISETMLRHVADRAADAGLSHVTTVAGAAEDLDLDDASFDAVVCRLGLMLFPEPVKALANVFRGLRPGGRMAAVVFTTPAANPFMAEPMRIMLRHAGKEPPPPGTPGVFALGAPGVLAQLLEDAGFAGVEERTVPVALRAGSAPEVLEMMQEAFGAYRAVVADQPEDVRAAAWAEVATFLEGFETDGGFTAATEVLVAAAATPT